MGLEVLTFDDVFSQGYRGVRHGRAVAAKPELTPVPMQASPWIRGRLAQDAGLRAIRMSGTWGTLPAAP